MTISQPGGSDGIKGPPGSNTDAAPTSHEENPIVVGRDGILAIVVLAVVIIVALVGIDNAIPAPSLVDPGSPVATSAQLAYYLARWGLVLTVVGFVSLLIGQVMRTFRLREGPKQESAESPSVAPWDKLFESIPALIKYPVGVGMSLILVAVTLLIAVALASSDDGEEPEPTPSPSDGVTATPSVDPSAFPSVSPAASPSR